MSSRCGPPIVGVVCVILGAGICQAGESGVDAAAAPVQEEVEVRGFRSDLRGNESSAAIKSNVSLRDLPVSAEVLGAEVLDGARFSGLGQTLEDYTLSGASPGDGGLSEVMVLRGFSDIPFYRDGISEAGGTMPIRDFANIASVEILKGPNSAIYGPGEPGGSINFETKKPQWESMHSIGAALGSYGRSRLELDTTGPLAPGSSLAWRLVGAVEDAASFRDVVNHKRYLGAPSLMWRPDERLSVLATLEFVRFEAPFDSGVIAVDGTLPLPEERFLGEPGTGSVNIDALTTSLGADYALNEAWRLSTALYWQENRVSGNRVEPDGVEDVDLPGRSALLLRELVDETEDTETLTAQLETQGELALRGSVHRLLAGYEYSRLRASSRVAASDSGEEPFFIDIFNPVYGQPLPGVEVESDRREAIDIHGLYLQDYIQLGGDWRLLAGTRLDLVSQDGDDAILGTRFDQDDEEFSSRIGLVYAPVPAISLFASFSESLDPNEGLTAAGTPLKSTRGRSVEGGVRIRQTAMGLSLDVAGFRIEQTNVTSEDPDAPGFEVQVARQLSRGVDFDLTAVPLPWLEIGVKYAFNDTEVRDDAIVPDGTMPLNAPRHKLVVLGLVSASLARESDLQGGLSIVTVSRRQASLNEEEFDQRLAGYTIVNAFANYTLTPHVTAGISVRNLLNNGYIAGSQSDVFHLTPGTPLTVLGTIRVHF